MIGAAYSTWDAEMLIRLSTSLIVGLIGLLLGSGADKSPGMLQAGGSTLVAPIMSQWAAEYAKSSGVQVSYQAIGSAEGIRKVIARELDFCCTDAPLSGEQLEKAKATGGEVLHIPLVMGAVVPIYHLEGVAKPLNFSGPVLAAIFMGNLTHWNDIRLVQLNPDIKLPERRIMPVHRADGSGTTFIFADFLYRTSETWREQMGRGVSLRWPEGSVGMKGGEGVGTHVKNTPGAMGYVDLGQALASKLPFGAVRNRKGEFIQGDLESVTTAAVNSLNEIPKDYRYSLANAPGIGSYPLCGTTWAVLYADTAAKNSAALAFLIWLVNSDGGQRVALTSELVPLPKGLVTRVRGRLAEVKQADTSAAAPGASQIDR